MATPFLQQIPVAHTSDDRLLFEVMPTVEKMVRMALDRPLRPVAHNSGHNRSRPTRVIYNFSSKAAVVTDLCPEVALISEMNSLERANRG